MEDRISVRNRRSERDKEGTNSQKVIEIQKRKTSSILYKKKKKLLNQNKKTPTQQR